jgi:hypothetical protein
MIYKHKNMNPDADPMLQISPASLNKQLSKLSQIISNPNSQLNEQVLQNYLSKLIYFSNLFNMTLKVEIKFDNYLCLQCQKVIPKLSINDSLKLECNQHVFCSVDCANIFIKIYTEDDILNFSHLRCVPCNIRMTRRFLEGIYGQAEFRDMLNKASAMREMKFSCDICGGEFKISEGITLDCNHRFCEGCLKMDLELKICESKVTDEDLQCPQGDNQLIDINIIRHIVSPEIFAKFERFRINLYRPDDLQDDELFFECHGVNCENRIILPVTDQEYKCTGCGFTSCPRCGDVVHKGVSCEAFKQWKAENDQADAKFQELMKNSQWIKCPWCQQVIERISGCKYMTCFSSSCRGKRYLCFDCKQGLASDHAPHPCVTP